MKKGLIHIYCGDGKGKTTAACGLAVRASGHGMKVVFVQFLKGSSSGEVEEMKKLGITVLRNKMDYGFLNQMSEEEKQKITEEHNHNLTTALQLVKDGRCGVLVLDEVMAAYNYHVIDTEQIDNLIKKKPECLELVLTGRNPSELFMHHADYITEMKNHKHPMDSGIYAREGIEY